MRPHFTAGVYDSAAQCRLADAKFKASEVGRGYRSYLLGTFEPGAPSDLFISPASNPGVKALWVDRVFLLSAP